MNSILINEEFNGRMYNYNLLSRMYKDRICYLFGAVDAQQCYDITAQLQYLEALDPKKDIKLYINSPGGEVTSGLAIVDVMKSIKPDIQTICMGMAASMASVILAAGTKGKRLIYPHSQVLIHQPLSGGLGGQASDVAIHANNLLKTKDELNKLLSQYTGQTVKKITNDTDRDNYLNAKEAVNYGIVDKIIQ